MIELPPNVFRFSQRVAPSSWTEHVPFMFWLMATLRPARFVELGTHTGMSYCAACQAVDELSLDTACHAVDSWEGDEQAGFYGEEVLADLREHHDPRYSAFSELLQRDFDDAVDQFEDGSIDLLHIDGLHTHEAVRHDFETWLPKLAPDAVVLFHDTNVHKPTFGVHRFWQELMERHRGFNFLHGHGLGVLCVGTTPPGMEAMMGSNDDRFVADTRRTFAHLGRAVQNHNAMSLIALGDRFRGAYAGMDMRLLVTSLHPDADDAMVADFQRDMSIARIRRTLRENPDDPDAMMQLSVAVNETGNIEEALELARKATRAQGDRADWFLHLSRLQRRFGQEQHAIATLVRAFQLDPDNETIANELSTVSIGPDTTH